MTADRRPVLLVPDEATAELYRAMGALGCRVVVPSLGDPEMTVTRQQTLATLNHSPSARNKNAPDPCWKQQQAFIRATRRGSKKRTTNEEKLKLLDAAQSAIPPAKVVKK